MAAAKIKKGDSVVVRSGKDKGRTGTVLQVLPKEDKVVVAGVNIATRHRKPSQTNPQGGIDRSEAPLHISKVSVADKDGKATRVRFEERDGKKVRVAVKSGEAIDG
ncbi:50S ribosomal protein L24 [Novosphingobium percolationis]|uniref:50S ribosomal protein L24 n=1 Tax=Novosphingobium percolationis TaxID=2871811 RepID=UPI001CD335FD|nr:50S ribosomal protein L24 [Novosphingobium percolationis]MCH7628457.1 50S ribosomal protein L24 [Pseudomonadota bacterium]